MNIYKELGVQTQSEALQYISSGKDIHKLSRKKMTFLQLAVLSGTKDIVQSLLDKKINVDHKDYHGNTALVYAVKENNFEIAKTLLYYGASIDFSKVDGVPLLEYLQNSRSREHFYKYFIKERQRQHEKRYKKRKRDGTADQNRKQSQVKQPKSLKEVNLDKKNVDLKEQDIKYTQEQIYDAITQFNQNESIKSVQSPKTPSQVDTKPQLKQKSSENQEQEKEVKPLSESRLSTERISSRDKRTSIESKLKSNLQHHQIHEQTKHKTTKSTPRHGREEKMKYLSNKKDIKNLEHNQQNKPVKESKQNKPKLQQIYDLWKESDGLNQKRNKKHTSQNKQEADVYGKMQINNVNNLQLNREVKIQAPDFDIFRTVELGENCPVLRYINRGGNIDLKTDYKSSLLQHACFHNNYFIAKILLDRGAEIDYVDQIQFTALSYAVLGGYLPLIKLLLSKNSNVSASKIDGITVLDYTYRNELMDIYEILMDRQRGKSCDSETSTYQMEIRESQGLQDFKIGAHSHRNLKSPSTPSDQDIFELIDLGDQQGVRDFYKLIKNRRQIVNEYDQTPLIYAIIWDKGFLVPTLLRAGVNIHHMDNQNTNALGAAIFFRQIRSIQNLVRIGCRLENAVYNFKMQSLRLESAPSFAINNMTEDYVQGLIAQIIQEDQVHEQQSRQKSMISRKRPFVNGHERGYPFASGSQIRELHSDNQQYYVNDSDMTQGYVMRDIRQSQLMHNHGDYQSFGNNGAIQYARDQQFGHGLPKSPKLLNEHVSYGQMMYQAPSQATFSL